MGTALFYMLQEAGLSKFLPVSPFQQFLGDLSGWDTIRTYAGYINYVFPVGWLVDLLTFWIAAIGVFYGVQAILRWANIIGS